MDNYLFQIFPTSVVLTFCRRIRAIFLTDPLLQKNPKMLLVTSRSIQTKSSRRCCHRRYTDTIVRAARSSVVGFGTAVRLRMFVAYARNPSVSVHAATKSFLADSFLERI